MYLNRNNIPKTWPIPKKGTKYVAISSHNQNDSIPLVIVMRDLLKIVKNSKELKKALIEKLVKINGKEVRDKNYPLRIFDVLTMESMKKNYKVTLINKKIALEEINEKEAKIKPCKVLSKKLVSGNKIQINFDGGLNILAKDKVNIGDTILLDLNENKIVKILEMKKGNEGFVIKGKHIGSSGKIDTIQEIGGKNIASISEGDHKINVWTKNVIVFK